MASESAEMSPADEWRSWKIGKRNIVPISLSAMLLLSAIATLLALSKSNNGFDITKASSGVVRGTDLSLSLTWTFLPALILQVFALWFGATVQDFGTRQPYIELQRGAIARKTITLDYSSFFPVQREYKAIKNGHWHLGATFALSLLLKIFLGPLGAHLFAEQPYSREITLTRDSALYTNVSANGQMGWDLASVISVASARLVDDSYSRWSDGTQAYLNFSTPNITGVAATQPTLNASTLGYSALLDCTPTEDVYSHLQIVPDSNTTNASARIFINGSDHGCFWRGNFAYKSTATTYLQTFSKTDCGPYGDNDSSGRLIIFAGQIKSIDDYNFSIMSCVPTYWTSSGKLSLDITANARNPILGWIEDAGSRRELRPLWWNIFEDQLQEVLPVDLSGNTISQSISAVGKMLLARAQAISSNPFDIETLGLVVGEVYANLYLTVIESYMIRPAAVNSTTQGLLTTHSNRLFVVTAIAGVILALLALAVAALVLVFIYSKLHRSVLFEEPIGLLGSAGLLANSLLNERIGEMKKGGGYVGNATTAFMDQVENSAEPEVMFIMDQYWNPGRAQITTIERRGEKAPTGQKSS